MSHRKNFFVTVAGFILAVLIESRPFLGILVSTCFLVVLIFITREKKHVVFAFLIVGMMIGFIRYEFNDKEDKSYIWDKQEYLGVVVDEPDIREGHTKLKVEIEETTVLVIADKYPEFKYGDEVKLVGKVERVENYNDFDYKAYLAKDEIYYTSYRPELSFISSNQASKLKYVLFGLKQWFINQLNKNIPEPESALAGGLLVGAKQSLGSELLEDFQKVGLIHIVVLSGFNIAIVAQFILYIFKFLPPKWSFGLGVVSIILFAMLAGGGPATVRASVMACIALVARKTGRKYSVTTALIVAGVFMVFVNPKVLVFDVGFQLSFLATLGIIYIAPILEKKLSFITRKFGIKELVVMTLSAQIAVSPWILYTIGSFSIVALPSNLLVLPLVPLTMAFSFAGGLFGFFFPWLAYLLLKYIVLVSENLAIVPFASLEISKFPLWLTIAMYLPLIFMCYYSIQHVVDKPTAEITKDKNFKHD